MEIERPRQYRRDKNGEQVGGNHTASSEALVKVISLRYLAAVKTYVCPHAVVELGDNENHLGGDTVSVPEL